MDRIRLVNLEKKCAELSKLLGRPLGLGCLRRRYRVEDRTNGGESGLVGVGYRTPAVLFELMDYAITCLEIAQRDRERAKRQIALIYNSHNSIVGVVQVIAVA